MIHSNIITGKDVELGDSSSLNNVDLGDKVTIGEHCTIFGSEKNILTIGEGSLVGSRSILNGYSAKLSIGKRCSIGSFCHFIVDTGPTASEYLLKKYPILEAPISVGDDCIIGHGSMVIAGVSIGDRVLVHPKSFVNSDIPSYSIVAGSPAKVIGKIEK